MKKRGINRLLAAILAMIMIAAVAACGDGSGNASQSPGASASPTGGNTGNSTAPTDGKDEIPEWMAPYGRYPETVVVTVAKSTPPTPNLLPGDTAEDSPMTRYILDVMNIKIEVVWEVPEDAYGTRLALQIASGDIPDSLTLSQRDFLLYRQLAENNLLADLQQGFDLTMGDNIRVILETFGDAILDPFRMNSELLAVAAGSPGWNTHNILWLRQEWLNGMSAPRTIEDIENILRAWKESPPAPGYQGLLLHHKDVSSPFARYSASPIFHALGAMPNAWVRGSDGQVTWGSVLPEVRDGLALLARWFDEGLIDQQFMARTAAGSDTALIADGQIGMWFGPWWEPSGGLIDLPTRFPEIDLTPLTVPVDKNGNFNVMFPNPIGSMIMMNRNHPHPEAVFKILNAEYDMWRGWDPVGDALILETRDNGVAWTYLFPTGDFNIVYFTQLINMSNWASNYVENGVLPPDLATPMQVRRIELAALYANEGIDENNSWSEYMMMYRANHPSLIQAANFKWNQPAFGFATDSTPDYLPQLNDLEATVFLRIIVGELPIEAFDQFVVDWYAQGGQILTDEARAIAG